MNSEVRTCSFCKSPGTTKSTCPLNPDVINIDAAKHPLAAEILSNKVKRTHKRIFININPKPCKSYYDMDQLSNNLLKTHKPEADGRPVLIMLMGIPGSGKTSNMSKFLEDIDASSKSDAINSRDFVLIGLDEMLLSLEEYKNALNLPLDTAYNANNVVDVVDTDLLPADGISSTDLFKSCAGPGRKLTSMMIDKSLAAGYNVIYDGTGQAPDIYESLIRKSKPKNYITALIYVNNDSEITWKRVRQRSAVTGRYVPRQIILSISEVLNNMRPFDGICRISDICFIYDNKEQLQKVLVVNHGAVSCLNKAMAEVVSDLCK